MKPILRDRPKERLSLGQKASRVKLGGGAILCWAGLVAIALAEPSAVIVLRPEALVEPAAEVRLGQIADIQAPPERHARLAEVSLGSAPIPGTTRPISAGFIALRLRRFGFNPADIQLQGETVLVKSAVPVALAPKGSASSFAWQGAATPASLRCENAPEPVLIRRGQYVELQVQCGAVTVIATGRAEREGRPNELIPVRLEKTGRTVLARVLGPGLVFVNLREDLP